MIRAIIVTHGDLGSEMIATARDVYGDVSECYAVSNRHKSPQTLRDELESILAGGAPGDRHILFVDFFGGSCTHACMAIGMVHDNVTLITGVNLPMFLAFLYKRKDVSFENLPTELLARGHESIQLVAPEDDQ